MVQLTPFDWTAPSRSPQSVGIKCTSGCKRELPLSRWSMGGNVVSVCIVQAECSPLMKGGYSSLPVIGGTKSALMLVNFWQGHSWAPVGSAWPLCSGWIPRIAEWGCNHICLWACLCYGPPMGCPSHLTPNPHFTFTRSSPWISLCYHALGKHKTLLHLLCWLCNVELQKAQKTLLYCCGPGWSWQDC